jgi:hypothetical protein
VIDVDAIPLDLPAKTRRPIGTAYVATVRTFPDGSAAIVPHYVVQGRPTSAHGPRGRPGPKETSTTAAAANVDGRGVPDVAMEGQRW